MLCRARSAGLRPLAAGKGKELDLPDEIVFPLTSADEIEVKFHDDDLEKRVVSTFKYDTYFKTDSLNIHDGPLGKNHLNNYTVRHT